METVRISNPRRSLVTTFHPLGLHGRAVVETTLFLRIFHFNQALVTGLTLNRPIGSGNRGLKWHIRLHFVGEMPAGGSLCPTPN